MTTELIETQEPRQVTTHLRLASLSKTYPGQDVAAVDDVHLDVEKGKLLALLGPSGCGKTTTLRMIAGLIEPTAGEIEVDGQDVTTLPVHKRGMGMVFQSYALFPHLDVTRNVAFGLEMRNVSKDERVRRVKDALDMVKLGHLGDRRVKELSGGQQQRVALARALVVEPSVLLLDEPLSNLDAKLRDAMRAEIRSLVHRLGVTTVFVTHDQDEALSMADQVAVMNDGKVEQIGAPEDIYERPSSRFVADFIGRANLLPGTVSDIQPDSVLVDVAGVGRIHASHDGRPLSSGQDVTLLIRPHRVEVERRDASAGVDRLKGKVTAHSYTGEMLAYTISVGDSEIEAETLTGFADTQPVGGDVDVTWRTTDAVVLPAPTSKSTK